jgi:ethanolamine ammonia-lyase small subunit
MSDPALTVHRSEVLTDFINLVRARTPARILTGRAGPAYRTSTQLELRRDHAAAVDAVHAEIDLECDFGRAFLDHWRIFEVRTRAVTKSDYLLRPDLGRTLEESARAELDRNCLTGADFQIVIGDGLSAAAVVAQVPKLLPLLDDGARARNWRCGNPFFVRHCRVGVLNGIGEWLDPLVAVLLIGERPGLATAESLSAYLAYQPRPGHKDAQRNLISNIHARGVQVETAAQRILNFAEKMRRERMSGVDVKEELPYANTGGTTLPSAALKTPRRNMA